MTTADRIDAVMADQIKSWKRRGFVIAYNPVNPAFGSLVRVETVNAVTTDRAALMALPLALRKPLAFMDKEYVA